MARHKSSKGLTPKSLSKLKWVMAAMAIGMTERNAAILSQLGGVDVRDIVAVGGLRYKVKQEIASVTYRDVIARLKERGIDIEYVDRFKVRAAVQTAVMRAFRFIESGEDVPWNVILAELEATNRVKWDLPAEALEIIVEEAKRHVYGTAAEAVKQAIQYGTEAEVEVAPAPETEEEAGI